MDIPGLWENYSKSTGARVGPGSGLLLDVAEQLQRGRLGPFEGASVAVFPDHPWHEEGGGVSRSFNGGGYYMIYITLTTPSLF